MNRKCHQNSNMLSLSHLTEHQHNNSNHLTFLVLMKSIFVSGLLSIPIHKGIPICLLIEFLLFYSSRLNLKSTWTWFLYIVRSRAQEPFFFPNGQIDYYLLKRSSFPLLQYSANSAISQVTVFMYLFLFSDSFSPAFCQYHTVLITAIL